MGVLTVNSRTAETFKPLNWMKSIWPLLFQDIPASLLDVVLVCAPGPEMISVCQDLGAERIICFEADPQRFEAFQQYFWTSPTVKMVNQGIGPASGWTRLSREEGSVGANRALETSKDGMRPNLFDCAENDYSEPILVSTQSLDTAMAQLGIDYHWAPNRLNGLVLNPPALGDCQDLAHFLSDLLEGAPKTLLNIDFIDMDVRLLIHSVEAGALKGFLSNYNDLSLIPWVSTLYSLGFSVWGTSESDLHETLWLENRVIFTRTPVLSFSTLGKLGRFGNQLFQYAFLKCYTQAHQLRIETGEWCGQKLFGIQDPPVARAYRPFVEFEHQPFHLSQPIPLGRSGIIKNFDLQGHCLHDTQYFKTYQSQIRQLFKPLPAIEEPLLAQVNRLKAAGHTLVGIHLRHGDYKTFEEDHFWFYQAPHEWYLTWLNLIWPTLQKPILFIASDELDSVLDDFQGFSPITTQGLGIEMEDAPFYPDFYFLAQCDALAISNSSYSMMACLLNKTCRIFARPHIPSGKLVSFNPWHTQVMWHREGNHQKEIL
jgi:hypothetical protein